ncbi:MAG: aminotransferase class I/II-fold pyridoxal phosphate-dependent enzyme [Deltaproteobacteria bacterium]
MDGRIERRLAALWAAGLYRDPHRSAAEALAAPSTPPVLDARSNDYLGLAASLASGAQEPGFAGGAAVPRCDPSADVSRETPLAPAMPSCARQPKAESGQPKAASEAVAAERGPARQGDLAPRVSRETVPGVRVGAGAARLISGTTPEHLDLERELASWLGMEACLLFSSAYAANLGVIGAVALPGDVVYSDALNHASIIDGCRLSRAEVVVVPHRDLRALAAALSAPTGRSAAKWVVSESYFGMDGTSPDVVGLRALCDEHGAGLIVDEAHALGVFGPEGRGWAAAQGVRPDVLVGGFGKAFGLQGGFAATSLALHRWLWNRARSFVFSTALSPWLSRRVLQHLGRLRGADPERRRLAAHARRLEAELTDAGVPLPVGRHGPVFPIVLGAEQAALDAALALGPLGVQGHAVRPPTVPRGTSRIRVTLRADMTEPEIDRLGAALAQVWGQYGADPQGRNSGTLASPQASSTGAVPLEQRPRPLGEHGDDRWVVLGTGTGVGKSFVAESLVRAIGARGRSVAGLKPIETGCGTSATGEPVAGDAARLEAASFHVKHPRPHPLYGFREPLAPSLAARREGQTIEPAVIVSWVDRVRSTQRGEIPSLVVETAGGVFSPLGDSLTNFDLALCLGDATWVLVAPDRLGVLHDLSSTLLAMKSLGRTPDWVVLNAPAQPDASTRTNAAELRRLGLVAHVLEVPRDEPSAVLALLPPLESRPPVSRSVAD